MKCTYAKQFVFHNFRERRSLLPWSGHPHREPKRRGTVVPVSPHWQKQAQLTYEGHGGESTTPRATVREEADQHKCPEEVVPLFKLLQSNIPDTQAVLVTGHKNSASLNNYRVLTNNQQMNISNLHSNTRPSPSSTTQIPDQVDIAFSQNVSNQNSSLVANNVPSFCLFSNTTITGGTFNITINTPTLPN